MKITRELSCWIVTEGMAGTENQCIGVANALGVKAKVFKVALKQPWAALSPWLGFECASTFDKDWPAPWPDLLITSGRKAVAASRFIKKQSNGHTFTLHIQDPRVAATQFDMVAVPYHDPMRGHNVVVTDAAPNKISDEALEAAKIAHPQFESFSSPRIAVLIGGKSKAYDMDDKTIKSLIADLQNIQNTHHASLLITASRRTGSQNMSALTSAFPGGNSVHFWNGQGDNPYLAYLAYADFILVTADSVSMISDALATGKPTYIIPMPGGARRIDLFHDHIIDKGYARRFTGDLSPYHYPPLREADTIASELRNKLGIGNE